MHENSRRCRAVGWTARCVALLAACVLLANAAGCAEWSYRQIRLGQSPAQYEQILPADKSRRTENALCSLQTDATGRTDAMYVLLGRDQRVSGKFSATALRRDYGFKADTGFQLVGEIDPTLADLKGTGPIDALRVVQTQLAAFRGERLAADAHAWVAAGVLRVLQRWPRGGEPTPDPPELAPILQKVPGGGRAEVAVGEDGVYRYIYTQGVVR